MRMNAYDELYLDDAMCNLGELVDYGVNILGYDANEWYKLFLMSGVAEQFEIGNPRYVTGLSGVEIAWKIQERIFGYSDYNEPGYNIDRTKEYWAGWNLAYYQWYSGKTFRKILDEGITMNKIIDMYIYHEADISKFVVAVENIVADNKRDKYSQLRRMRKYWGLTQKELSKKSGVSLRMVQLYEQGQNDLSKAGSEVLCNFSKVLKCKPQDLLN